MIVLNGTQTALEIKESLKKDIEENLLSKGFKAPKLSVIIVGDNPASKIYVAGKAKACALVGIESQIIALENDVSQKRVERIIKELNEDPSIDGILLQLPLPDQLDETKLINMISPEKDVDGLTKINMGKLVSQDFSGLFGCTPSGIISLLKKYNIDLTGKDVVIVNRSMLVGKPLALMFLNENATVTVCHRKTKNLKEKTLNADIVVCAVGCKDFLTKDMIKQDAIVVDVGINRAENSNKIFGDADYENVSKKASFITPVPGGVGPMTIAMLLRNTYVACMRKHKS